MLTHFPSSITAGFTLDVSVDLPEYPAPDWGLLAILRGEQALDLASIAAGVNHRFSETGATTGGWAAGVYAFSLRAVRGADVREIEAGQITIAADLASVEAGHDSRSHAQKVLEAVEAVLEGRASKDQQSYTINGRTLVRMTIADLLTLRDRYRTEVAAQKSGGRSNRLLRRQVKVRFGR